MARQKVVSVTCDFCGSQEEVETRFLAAPGAGWQLRVDLCALCRTTRALAEIEQLQPRQERNKRTAGRRVLLDEIPDYMEGLTPDEQEWVRASVESAPPAPKGVRRDVAVLVRAARAKEAAGGPL